MARLITCEDINQRARPKLSKAILRADRCYLLSGDLPKNKRTDVGELTVLLSYGERYELATDGAAIHDEPEFWRPVAFSIGAAESLMDVLIHDMPYLFAPEKPKSNAGRPTKYGLREKAKARRLREEGFSIRAIAHEMNASTATIQKLLK